MGSRARTSWAEGIILSMALGLGFSEQKPQWKGTITQVWKKHKLYAIEEDKDGYPFIRRYAATWTWK